VWVDTSSACVIPLFLPRRRLSVTTDWNLKTKDIGVTTPSRTELATAARARRACGMWRCGSPSRSSFKLGARAERQRHPAPSEHE
jgi:hypothetical protein